MMEFTVISMWAISGLLACWSFSFFVRGVSEVLARKRTHLNARRSTRALMMGFVLMVVCAGAALLAGWTAVYLEPLYNNGNTRLATPLVVIGASVSLFAACLVVWGAIGDRARGRVRCPKCWYDMSGATGLQCPECGRIVRDETKFTKARRPKWAFVAALVLLFSGIYSVSVSKRVQESGPLGAVPTWVLIAGWEYFPDSWILNISRGSRGSLLSRILFNTITDSQYRSLAERLTSPLEKDRLERMDQRRLELLQVLYYSAEPSDSERRLSTWDDLDLDIDQLFYLSVQDLYNALIEKDADQFTYDLIHSHRLILITEGMIKQRAFASGELSGGWPIVTAEFMKISQPILDEFQKQLDTEQFWTQVWSEDEGRSSAAAELLKLTNSNSMYFEHWAALDCNESLPVQMASLDQLGYFFQSADSELKGQMIRTIQTRLEHENPRERAFALATLYSMQWLISEPERKEQFGGLIPFALESLYDDTRVKILVDQDAIRVQDWALMFLDRYDEGNIDTYQAIYSLLVDTGEAPPINQFFTDQTTKNKAVRNWLIVFPELRNSPNPAIRMWYIQNLPKWTRTAFKEGLDQLAADMLNDPDKEIDRLARRVLWYRNAEYLIPTEKP